MEKIPVKDIDGLVRGANNVIHNVDKEGYDAFVAHRNKILSDTQRIEKLETSISVIHSMLNTMMVMIGQK